MKSQQKPFHMSVFLSAIFLLLGGFLLGACSGTSSSGTNQDRAPVMMDVFLPFSGPQAVLGNQFALPGVRAAAYDINKHGGILGHQLVIEESDSKGDAADAVQVANHLLSTSQPAAIIGPATAEGPATIPLFNHAHIVMMSPDGGPELDGNTSYPYVYRPLPPDSSQGTAMSAVALKKGWTRAAIVFGSDEGSQTIVPGLKASYTAFGGTITTTATLQPDQPSYRSEVQRVLASRPQVIFTETDGQSAATFFSELQQQNGSELPVVGSTRTSAQDYLDALGNAVGKGTIGRFLLSVDYGNPNTLGQPTYTSAFNQVPANKGIDRLSGANSNLYDAVVVVALAMNKAKSLDPAMYSRSILAITNDSTQKVVSDYQSGVAALQAGENMYYDGASGPMQFNTFHSVLGDFDISRVDASDHPQVVQHLTAKEVSAYIPSH